MSDVSANQTSTRQPGPGNRDPATSTRQPATRIASNVIQLITMDILEGILGEAENPGKLGEYLTARIRELIGGRMVALVQFDDIRKENRIISVSPPRQRKLTDTPEFRGFLEICPDVDAARISGKDEGPPQAKDFLEKARWRNFLAVPLRVGSDRLGILLVFHMMDNRRLQDALVVLDTLTTVMALVLRNSLLYEEQEAIIEARTQELSRKERMLMEAEKMAALGRLVAGVSHEINTPVGICVTAASALVDRTRDIAANYSGNKMKRSDLEHYLQSAHKTGKLILGNMQRTGDLIQSFKQVAVDQTAEQPRRFRVKAYLEEIILSLGPKLKQKPIRTDIECEADLEMEGFPGALAQIVTNLVINSLIHGFGDISQGRILIRARIRDELLCLEYQDDGQGIPPEVLPKIFDPFFTTNMQAGTGLGMHIVYNIVSQKLKGSISCESEPGRGATFTMTMPVRI